MKINEKHLISFVSGSAAIDKQGFLNKRGEVNKAFQRRWFVLKGNLLFYFERRTDAEPIGVIVIDGCSVELTENSDKYAFELAFSGSGTRTYVLAAESQVTAKSAEWRVVKVKNKSVTPIPKGHNDQNGCHFGYQCSLGVYSAE